MVGRVVLGEHLITVLPPIDDEAFSTFFSYAHGLNIPRARPVGPVASRRFNLDFFGPILAQLMAGHSRMILRTHLSQTYERRIRQLHGLRGRPHWTETFGRHPAQGVSCLLYEKTTNNPLNQLILAGLVRARQFLGGHSFQIPDFEAQYATWQAVASPRHPNDQDFQRALRDLNRQTDHYRSGLVLARLLWFGFDPANIYKGGGTSAPLVVVDLSRLYHRFLRRLIAEALPEGFSIRSEQPLTAALVDGTGATYLEPTPDLIVYSGSSPKAVIDAKFKPRYGECGKSGLPRAKVSPTDTYQVLFYQAQLKRMLVAKRLPAFILVPSLREDLPPASRYLAISARSADGEGSSTGFRVVPTSLHPLLRAIRSGKVGHSVVASSPALDQLVHEITMRRDDVSRP